MCPRVDVPLIRFRKVYARSKPCVHFTSEPGDDSFAPRHSAPFLCRRGVARLSQFRSLDSRSVRLIRFVPDFRVSGSEWSGECGSHHGVACRKSAPRPVGNEIPASIGIHLPGDSRPCSNRGCHSLAAPHDSLEQTALKGPPAQTRMRAPRR